MSDKNITNQEVKNVRKNYTRTPNMLFESYEWLHPQEKWLFINLVYLCGAKGTRHLSLRYISEKTGISVGALSGSKDPAKNNPGMIRNLHNAGLIHAEIRKRTLNNGKEKDQAQYHITITDIWQLNDLYFSKERSENEHLDEEEEESVQDMNASVRNMNTSSQERSENEQERSENHTNIRLQDKTTDTSKITKQDSIPANASQPPLQLVEPPKPKTQRSPKPVEPAKSQIDEIYTCLDDLAREVTGVPDFCYPRSRTSTDAIKDLLHGQKPNPERLHRVYMALWNTPKDEKTGFDWKEHMTVPAICRQYGPKIIALEGKNNQAQQKKPDDPKLLAFRRRQQELQQQELLKTGEIN